MIKHKNSIILFSFIVVFIIITFGYIYNNYEWKNDKIESIELHINKSFSEVLPIIYITDKTDLGFDLSKPYKAIFLADSTISFKMEDQLGIRKLRFYFEKEIDELIIEKIVLKTTNGSKNVELNELKDGSNLQVINNDKNKFTVKVPSSDGYLELPNFYFYPSDKQALFFIFISALMVLIPLFLLLKRIKILERIKFPSIPDLSVILFIFSIFLPHPIFNVMLILSLLVMIKNFNFKSLVSNKASLIFIGLFFVFFLNDLFISESGFQNLKATEKYLPLLILPLYISCIKESKFIIYFPISAFIIGIGLVLTSISNAIIFNNIGYFSFTEFTKFTHPVYYSYLVSFSIFYVLLYAKLDKLHKTVLQLILFLFLILAGSKMVITITLIIYAGLFIKSKKSVLIVLSGFVLLALFSPVQNRFKEVLNFNDLSIINDKVITDNNDSRVNGLTLRLLLWQESINAVETIPEYIFGLGVDDASDKKLKSNLMARGLEKYSKYSSHNQFINVFMRTGFVGLLFLIFLVAYGLYNGVKSKNKMLLIMIILFTFAMLTESVLQRVLGIYFFTTVLLFLMKPNFLNENSNNRD
jgi:hypothetical protein